MAGSLDTVWSKDSDRWDAADQPTANQYIITRVLNGEELRHIS